MSGLSPDIQHDYPLCSKPAFAYVCAWTHSGIHMDSLCFNTDLGIGTIQVLSKADAELFKKMS